MKLACSVDLDTINEGSLTGKQIQGLLLFVLEFKQKYEQGIPSSVVGKTFEALQLIASANKTQDWELDFIALEKIIKALNNNPDGHSIWMLVASSVMLTSLYKGKAYASEVCLSLIPADCDQAFILEVLENLELKSLDGDVSYELRYILQNVLVFRLKEILANKTQTKASDFEGVPISWVIKMLDDLKVDTTKVEF